MCGNNYLMIECMLVHRIDKYLVNGKGGLGVIQNCHHFHELTESTLGGRRSMVTICFLNVD